MWELCIVYKLCKTEQSAKRQRELEQGLLTAMLTHQYEEISVSDLCDQMNIPRKSFYRYFSSKDGALFALLDHTLMEFYDTGSIEGLRGGTPVGDLERLFSFWKSHNKLIDALLRSNLSGILVERAVSLAKQEKLMPGYVKAWEDTLQDVAMSFAVCGLMSMVLQWHNEGYKIPTEKMAQAAVTMLSRPLIPTI